MTKHIGQTRDTIYPKTRQNLISLQSHAEAFYEPYRENEEEPFVLSKMLNYSYPPHFHFSFELLYGEVGEITVHINGQSKVLRPGDLAVIAPGDIHSFESMGETRATILIFIESHFPEFRPIFDQYALKQNIFPFSSALIDQLFEQSRKTTEENLSMICFKGYINCIFHEVLKNAVLVQKTSLSKEDTIRKALICIHKKYREGLNLEQTARELGLSAPYLSMTFKKIIGYNFNEYINLVRGEKSKRWLEDSTLPIMDIAIECGFSNQRTFDRVFKKITNMTPKEYRNLFGNK
jgi:AraC-like DNA-binding protein/mannose-6-phosphate isomerase-like protein (cupin superfamily)